MAKQDVSVRLFYGGDWHVMPAYIDDPIRITRGRPEGSEPTPTVATLSLAGYHNPKSPLSPLYGLAGQNTPARIFIDGAIRIYGEVSSWEPHRTVDYNEATGRGKAWTAITISGTLRRLGQGNPPERSAMTRALLTTSPLAWWPLELDLTSATSGVLPGLIAASPVGPAVRQPLQLVTTDVQGTAALVDLSNGTRIDLPVPAHTLVPTTGYQVEFMSRWQAAGFTGGLSVDALRMQFTATGNSGDTERVQVETDTDHEIFTFTTNQAAAFARDDAVDEGDVYDGAPRHIRVRVYQDGTDVVTEMWVNGVYRTVSLLASSTLTTMTSISLNFVGELGTKIPAIGQVIVYLSATVGPGAAASDGYLGETAGERFGRLCEEDDIPNSVIGTESDTQEMGPQQPGTLTSLLAEVERTDDGILIEPRTGPGLYFRTGRDRYNQDPALVLDYAANEVAPPLALVLDDLSSRNDVTAQSLTGSARAVLEDGPLSVQEPPDGIGRYKTKVDVNPAADTALPDHAWWHLAKGTVDGARYASVTVDLVAKPGLTSDIELLDLGDVIAIDNLPADEATGRVRLLVTGYTEVIGSHTRVITFDTIPADPYDIAVWGSDAQGSRWGANDTTLAEDLTTVETAADVDTGTDTWATTASHPTLFPAGGGPGINVDIGGLVYSCTAITGTHPNLTLTLVRLASDKTHTTGDPVTVTDTGRYGI